MTTSFKYIARTRAPQTSLRLASQLFGLSLLSLSIACGAGKGPEVMPGVAGAAGSNAAPGVGGNNAGAPSHSGSGGGIAQAAGAGAGGASAGSASGGTTGANAGAGGQTSSNGGAANAACAYQCVDQCVERGGTKKDGSCGGAQLCCDGTLTPLVNPLAHLIPSAQKVGLLLANRFAKQPLTIKSMKEADYPGDGYKVACEWYGSLSIAKSTNTQSLLDSLVTKFDPLKATNFVDDMLSKPHVDRYIFAIVPLEIYLQTGNDSYLPLGIKVAKDQHGTNQTRGAIDDMFMMTVLQLQAYRAQKRAGGDAAEFTNFMAPIMVQYLAAQKTDGLFNHNDEKGPVKWGRGNGWFAAGLAEMLRDLPATDKTHYPTILADYQEMMAGLLKVQSKSGLWYQVLDSKDAANWEETSGSAMFTYAMIAGVRRGLLDAATYVPAIDAAWAALQTKISAQGDLSGICPGTYFLANVQEYLKLKPITGDGHGQAPVLWSAAELLR